MKKLSASKLRADIYRVLDEIIETGVAIEIERKGVTLKIAPKDATPRSRGSKKRDWIIGDPDELISIDWSKEWSELK